MTVVGQFVGRQNNLMPLAILSYYAVGKNIQQLFAYAANIRFVLQHAL